MENSKKSPRSLVVSLDLPERRPTVELIARLGKDCHHGEAQIDAARPAFVVRHQSSNPDRSEYKRT